jgi:D-alanyl-D-alanine carboxypeptidase/D-alanyl-D-alanine-endopeptidase (penicillin-binding protein 4)
MDLYDGSGVSWYNSVTPHLLAGVLLDQYRRKETFGRFLATLPVAGRDGTLEQRMRSGPATGRIRAKTGTLTAVSTLSGYAETLAGETLVFSIMISHFPGNLRVLRELQDAVAAELVRLAPAGAAISRDLPAPPR